MRIGYGWDRHRLVENRPCVLGGIRFPDAGKGPLGHSDGDAVCHAVIDALLGAAALGDIGVHFPDDDPRWKGADSLDLLGRVRAILEERGWRIGNIDTVIIAEEPRISPVAVRMREALAGVLHIDSERVSVKATRGEGIGPEGRGECVTVQAVALVEKS